MSPRVPSRAGYGASGPDHGPGRLCPAPSQRWRGLGEADFTRAWRLSGASDTGAAGKGCSLCCHGYTEARSDAVIFSPAVPIYWWHPGDTRGRQEGSRVRVLPGTGSPVAREHSGVRWILPALGLPQPLGRGEEREPVEGPA